MPIPTASGDFAAFFTPLFRSIRSVTGTDGDVGPPTTSSINTCCPRPPLNSWRAVFQSLLAGDWDSAHLQARMISSTYNVVQFLDTRTGRVILKRRIGRNKIIAFAANLPACTIAMEACCGAHVWRTG